MDDGDEDNPDRRHLQRLLRWPLWPANGTVCVIVGFQRHMPLAIRVGELGSPSSSAAAAAAFVKSFYRG